VEVVSMLDQLPQQRSEPEVVKSYGDRALRWSWLLFVLSYPWHLVGGGIALVITWLAGGDFGAGEGVPGYVYPALYAWMMAPLVASIVVGMLGWVKGKRPAAIVPALASLAIIVFFTVFSFEEFWA
jgi:fatty acid desaturase